MNGPAAQPAMDGSGPDHRWFGRGTRSKRDRHPLLETAMESAARALTRSLGFLSASPAEVSFNGIETGAVEDFAASRSTSSVVAILQAPAWDSAVALRFDRAFVSTVVEALFGGAGDADDPAPRDFPSPVETRVAALIAEQVLEALTIGFEEILPTSFALEPLAAKPDLLPLGKPATPVLVATLLLKTLDRLVELSVAIPCAVLHALVDRSATAALEAPPRNSRWAERLEAEVGRAAMHLRASLDLPPMSLGQIAGLRPGQVLAFALGAANEVALSCEGGHLFRCVLGQSDGHYTLRVDESLAAQSPSPRKDH